jgi:hypothetical protein
MTGIVNSTGARSGVIGTTVGTPSGGVIQTLSKTYTGVSSGTQTTPYLAHADCSLAITPSSATNKILITVHSSIASDSGVHASLHFYKDSSEISGAMGVSGGTRVHAATGTGYISTSNTHHAQTIYSVSAQYADVSGGTSSIAYSYRIRTRQAGSSWYINRYPNDTGVADTIYQVHISTITLQEIVV